MTPSNLSKSWRNFQVKKRQCGDLQLLVSENIIINMKVEEKAIGVELVFHQENLHFRSMFYIAMILKTSCSPNLAK